MDVDYKYSYKDPTETGYKRFKLTKKQHNQLFPNRKVRWFCRYEYFYNDWYVLLHQFTNWKGIVVNTLLAPVLVLMYGIVEMKREYKRLYNEKELGAFSSNTVRSKSEKYDEIMNIINRT
jgi:hypothetical protein